MYLRILHIEDHPGDRLLMRQKLESSNRGWIVEGVATLAEGLAAENVDIVLLDLGLPDSEGLETLARFRLARPSMPIVVLTAHREEAMALQALREGADDFLCKDALTSAALMRSVYLSLERRRLRVELEQSKQNFSAIVHASQDPIWVIDALGETHFANAAALEFQGDDHAAWGPNPVQDSVHLLGGRQFQLRVTPTLWFGKRCTLVMAYDVTVTQQRKAETERLRRTLDLTRRRQDLERLATGLAHSINNALVGVLSVASRVDPIDANELTEATERIRGITHLMGTFSEDQARTAGPNNLRASLERAHLELKERAGKNIDLEFKLEEAVSGAHYSKEYLRPILWTLMDNALLAGCCKASLTGYVEQGFAVVEWSCHAHRLGTPKREPMSWDELGSGTRGLALTAAQAFALSAKGHAELWQSTRHKNEIRLCMFLPLAAVEPEKGPTVTRAEEPMSIPEETNGLRTLVVDDNTMVRRVICTTLRRQGHQVFEAEDGRAGLNTAKEVDLDVIVCDVRMPQMDGPTMVRKLREAGRTTPVLILSGFSEVDMPAGENIACLAKPFLPADLKAAIEALLEDSQS